MAKFKHLRYGFNVSLTLACASGLASLPLFAALLVLRNKHSLSRTGFELLAISFFVSASIAIVSLLPLYVISRVQTEKALGLVGFQPIDTPRIRFEVDAELGSGLSRAKDSTTRKAIIFGDISSAEADYVARVASKFNKFVSASAGQTSGVDVSLALGECMVYHGQRSGVIRCLERLEEEEKIEGNELSSTNKAELVHSVLADALAVVARRNEVERLAARRQ